MGIESVDHPGRVLARLARQIERAVASVELTLAQYRVLILLSDGEAAASRLAEKLAVSRPSVTGVVDGLVARGLVARGNDSEDRRRVRHDLTPEGHRLLALADAKVATRLGDIASHRPEGAAAALAELGPWQDALDADRQARTAQVAP